MSLSEQVYAHAVLLAGELEENQSEILRVLCLSAAASLGARLREGLSPEDCKADFIAAASLFALAAMNTVKDSGSLEQVTAGDLTIRKTGRSDAASNCLRSQAELMIAPYLKDRFSFQGV